MHRLSPVARIASWRSVPGIDVELHLTPCIVTFPPHAGCSALVNPANERLEGTRFTPGECADRLAPGTTALYPPQAVDGIVHGARGGDSSADDSSGASLLAAALSALPVVVGDDIRCPTGQAVATAAHGELSDCYEEIIHCVPPFYASPQWRPLLLSAYANALRLATSRGAHSIAVPLLGAGARGAPAAAAAEVVAEALSRWRAPEAGCRRTKVCIGVVDDAVASAVVQAADAEMERTRDDDMEYHCLVNK